MLHCLKYYIVHLNKSYSCQSFFSSFKVYFLPCFREEIEKQKAKERYMKMHLAGKTDQAKADLARLAIIRKQREEAARKKDEERKGK